MMDCFQKKISFHADAGPHCIVDSVEVRLLARLLSRDVKRNAKEREEKRKVERGVKSDESEDVHFVIFLQTKR